MSRLSSSGSACSASTGGLRGADLPGIDRVPDGVTQCVYWVDGDVIERVSRDGRWTYSLAPVGSTDASPDSWTREEPHSVHGGC